MAQVCVKHLLNEAGTGKVILVNRSPERVHSFLGNNLPNRERISAGLSFDDRFQLAGAADLVIVSTSAPDHILKAEDFQKHGLPSNPVIIDISVPRNVDPAIADVSGVRLFNADDLAAIVNQNLAQREALVGEAEHIVFQALDDYHAWQRSLLVVPTIAELRQKIESIRLEQMEKNQGTRKGGQPGDAHAETAGTAQLEEISRAIVNQILHHPTVQLKATRDYQILRQQAEALRTLFSLDGKPTECGSGRRADKTAPCQHASKKQADPTQDEQAATDIAAEPHPANRGA
jgi:glutamyl-tRNA reductase